MWNESFMLGRFGFGSRWRGCINECISSTLFSAFVNSSPTRLFKASRGLRQGDCFPLFLFTIFAEAMGKMLMKAKEVG